MPILLHPSKRDLPLTAEEEQFELEPDPEALIREARRRQRKRRLAAAGASVLLAGAGVTVWRVAFGDNPRAVARHGSSKAIALPPTLTVHLVGWGTPIQGLDPGGACPDGKFGMRVLSSLGESIGSFVECDLVVGKTDKPNWGVRSTHAALATTYTIPGGTITADEQRSFVFSRQYVNSNRPVKVRGGFRGRIAGGTGRYAHARGTITGGGLGTNNNGNWTVTFHFNER